jgi:hypothetical protein
VTDRLRAEWAEWEVLDDRFAGTGGDAWVEGARRLPQMITVP